MRKQEEVALFGNLTAMIDVVFQIIIFFVVTSSMQDSARDNRIVLAPAPHGTPVREKDSREIVVDVNSKGDISISRTRISQSMLATVLTKARKEYGGDTPVIIRGDRKAIHGMVKTVMDTCAGAGIWKIKIAAVKEGSAKGGAKGSAKGG
jgi:biopolymer transport protein ExbD